VLFSEGIYRLNLRLSYRILNPELHPAGLQIPLSDPAERTCSAIPLRHSAELEFKVKLPDFKSGTPYSGIAKTPLSEP